MIKSGILNILNIVEGLIIENVNHFLNQHNFFSKNIN